MLDIQPKSCFTYLIKNLIRNIESFSQLLGRNIDETFILLYEIFHRMRLVEVCVRFIKILVR